MLPVCRRVACACVCRCSPYTFHLPCSCSSSAPFLRTRVYVPGPGVPGCGVYYSSSLDQFPAAAPPHPACGPRRGAPALLARLLVVSPYDQPPSPCDQWPSSRSNRSSYMPLIKPTLSPISSTGSIEKYNGRHEFMASGCACGSGVGGCERLLCGVPIPGPPQGHGLADGQEDPSEGNADVCAEQG